MTKHTELIARLEALTGPDREVDWRIAERLDIPCFWPKSTQWPPFVRGSKYEQQIPLFTSSIDAAVALCERVLPEFRWGITQGTEEDEEAQGNVWPASSPFTFDQEAYGYHKIPAIALLIATLKALDAKESDG